jgi:hypothetical protein
MEEKKLMNKKNSSNQTFLNERSEGLISFISEFSFSFFGGSTVLLEEQHNSQKNLDKRGIDFNDSGGSCYIMSCHVIVSKSHLFRIRFRIKSAYSFA